MIGLLPTQAREPCGGAQIDDGSVHWLDLIDPVVAFQSFKSLFP